MENRGIGSGDCPGNFKRVHGERRKKRRDLTGRVSAIVWAGQYLKSESQEDTMELTITELEMVVAPKTLEQWIIDFEFGGITPTWK